MSNALLLRRRMMMQSKKDNILTFTAAADNSSVKLAAVGSPTAISLEYKTKGHGWSPYTIGDVISLPRTGDYVKMRGVNNTFSTNDSNRYRYTLVGSIAASGDVTSLLNGKGGDVALPTSGIFMKLFESCTSLISAPALPSTVIKSWCYQSMFMNTRITEAPLLPATTIFFGCYYAMFSYCRNITQVPVLPATIVPGQAYMEMFRDCISLQSPSPVVLPATRVENGDGYKEMFAGCTSLTKLDYSAFDHNPGCPPNLNLLIVRVTTPPYTNTNLIPNTVNKIYVPYSADHSILNAYKNNSIWGTFASKIFELDENGEIPE